MSKIRFVGLDVHADSIAVAIAEPDGEVHPLGMIPNRLGSIRKLVVKLGPTKQLKACYEAGAMGCETQERGWSLGSPEDRPLFQAAIPNKLPTNGTWPAGSSLATHCPCESC